MPRKKLTEAEKAAKKAAEEAEAKKIHRQKTIHDEIWAIIILAIGVFLALSLFTNTTGVIGEWVSKILGGVLGWAAYVLPFFLVLFGVLIFANKTAYLSVICFICSAILFILLSCLVGAYVEPLKGTAISELSVPGFEVFNLGLKSGGVIGSNLAYFIVKGLGMPGLWIIGIVGIIVCSLFIFNTPLSELIDSLKVKAAAAKKVREEQLQIKYEEQILKEKEAEEAKKLAEANMAKESAQDDNLPKLNLDSVNVFDKEPEEIASSLEEEVEEEYQEKSTPVFGDEYSDNQKNILGLVSDDNLFGNASTKKGTTGLNPSHTVTSVSKVTAGDVAKVQEQVSTDIQKSMKTPMHYKFPPIDLLKKGSTQRNSKSDDGSQLTEILEKTLESFGVDAKVVNVTKGPAVTRFEVQPGFGVKVSSISRLHDDLALNLRAESLRIEAPIPGKAVVGIEVSNNDANMVCLREIIDSKEFKNSKSKITVALGRGISGESVVANLKDMPHLLIAGATGSGKSVCINSFIISLMYKATPDQVKLILIDPKVVELQGYNGIPHLLIPVV
ncbi:MAG: DNA translocase FtsK 4TM domain-containing protein, partial [Bacillota bacterium]|nr:DNA translocase FtsK 4TM domain-containing protein [Bacillota bacterium]